MNIIIYYIYKNQAIFSPTNDIFYHISQTYILQLLHAG